MLGRLRLLVAPMAIAGVLMPTAAHATVAVPAGEKVDSDVVIVTVGPDGVLHVTETIAFEFAGSSGLERAFVTRVRDNDTRDRVFKLSNVTASSPDGGPATLTGPTADGDRTRFGLKAPGPLTGRHTVSLSYDVSGAIMAIGTDEELRWTAVGGWQVPILQAKTTVESTAAIHSLNCFAGVLGSSTGCTQFFTDHAAAQGQFGQQNLLSDEYLTVVVGYPLGTTNAKPIYEMRRTLATAFSINRVTGGALAALLLLLIGGFGALYMLRGRDARVVGKLASEGDRSPVEADAFAPPADVRPGQIGTLIDEQADVIDVTATIVDLAVRGYLLIEEEDRAATGRLDWKLIKQDRTSDLLPYEQLLFDALFAGRASVRLSELGGTFADQLTRVREAMYKDVVTQGWFTRRPDAVRTRWTTAGLLLIVLGIAGTIALAIFTDLAVVGLAVIIGGAALAYGGRFMPAKTAHGAAVLAHTIGFRAHLLRGDASEVPEAQRIPIYSRYLPYAVVFDAIGHWSRTVENEGIRAEGADNLYWYEGPAEWDLSNFAESMRAFTLATSGAISQSRQFRSLP
jgi:Predicted membrane protein (DUF2207)